MLAEYPETEGLFLGAERLGRLVGRSEGWIRQREVEGVIDRTSPNGGSSRQLYNADDALPRLVAFLSSRKQPSPEQLALVKERFKAAKLVVEQRKFELQQRRGRMLSVDDAVNVLGQVVVAFRRRMEQLTGSIKHDSV